MLLSEHYICLMVSNKSVSSYQTKQHFIKKHARYQSYIDKKASKNQHSTSTNLDAATESFSTK